MRSRRLPLATLACLVVGLLSSGCRSTVDLLPPAERPRPRETVQLEYPATTGERLPLQIAYFEAGEGAELFVLFHGLSTNADAWARVVDGLAAHGTVIAVDLPGCGWSDAPRDFAYDPVGIADVAAQFVQVAPALAGLSADTRPVLAGASLGGGIVTYLTVTGAARPRALLLAAPASFPLDLPFYIEVVRGPLGPFLFWMSTLAPYERLAGFSFHNKEVLTPDLGAMFARQFRDPDRRHAAHLINKNGIDMEVARWMSERIPEIDVPVLVVFATEDVVIPSDHADRWRESLPDARVVVLEDCGHDIPEERPGEFLELCGQLLGWPATR